MAIAPLPDLDAEETPWPRPALRLVEPLVEEPLAGIEELWPRWAGARHGNLDVVWDAGDRLDTESGEALSVSVGPDAPVRRGRASSRVRRRRLALGVLVAGLLVALALPLSALGGRPAPAAPATAASSTSAVGTVYTVRPGDTLWSIASRVDGGGDPRPLVEALSARLGSTTVVPGERIVIP